MSSFAAEFVALDNMLTRRESGAQVSNLVQINNNQIVCATNEIFHLGPQFLPPTVNRDVGILIYNINAKKWRLFLRYPKHFKPVNQPTIFYNPSTNVLWLYHRTDFIKVNMKTKECIAIKSVIKTKGICVGPEFLFANNKLHWIGGSDNEHHQVWDKDKQKFEKVFKFSDRPRGFYYAMIVYAKNKNMLYVFGGYDDTDKHYTSIWECKMNENNIYKWTKWEVTLKIKVYYDAYVLTPDERYIIIFDEEIYIFDVEEKKFYQSGNVEIGNLTSAVLCTNERAGLIVGGYVREIAKTFDLMIPNELMGIFKRFYSEGAMVYLKKYPTKFVRIPLSSILNAERVLIN